MAKKEVYTWHDTLNSISYQLKRIADSLEAIEVQNDLKHRESVGPVRADFKSSWKEFRDKHNHK
jgi:hypothetical protein